MNVSEIKTLIDKAAAQAPDSKSIAEASTLIPQASANEAVIVQLSGVSSYTLAQLETHLKDDAKGQGYKSKQGYAYTAQRETEGLSTLANTDFAAFNLATRFLSGQSQYGYRVRAMEGIRQAAITSTQLHKLADQLKNLKK